MARKESGKNGMTTVLGAITDVVVNVLFIHRIGLYAASISTLIAYFVLFLVRWIDIRKICSIQIYKRTLVFVIVFLYVFITCYFNILLLNIVNSILAIIVFLLINKNHIVKVIKRLVRR